MMTLNEYSKKYTGQEFQELDAERAGEVAALYEMDILENI